MSEKAFGHLKKETLTWMNLCKLDKDLQLLTCNFFSYKNLDELKAVCPDATTVRGRIFYKAKNLTENLLAKLLSSIQGGLTEIISFNCKDQITQILTQIKEKDQDIFADITNSHADTTFCDQIDSFKQLIDLQLTELTILTARYNDFKTVKQLSKLLSSIF